MALLIGILLFTSVTYAVDSFKANAQSSEVAFSGEHAGMKFEGRFTKWQAQLNLPPADKPYINASFDMQSANTGDSIYDATLTEGDWFDADNFPQGFFDSTSIELKNGDYHVKGELSIKGIKNPVEFVLKKDNKWLTAEFKIDRIAYNIGVESDPEAEWVSRQIALTLRLKR